jgi:glycosyltransferase involved in cell wall biosynthesis
MNIVLSIHLYPPHHNCGAEMMIHRIAKHLQSKGHQIRVLLHQANHYRITNNYVYDGVDVFPPNPNVIENLFHWCDAVFTHLDYTKWTISMAAMKRKPLFHLIHNSHKYPEIVQAEKNQHIIYNSEWIKEELKYDFDNFVLTPPINNLHFSSTESSDKNEFITLINLNENKGGKILEQIARALPNKQFLAVMGSYDEQFIPKLDNVKVVANKSNIKPVYEQTRLLLMPSKYESWGMTASEAMSYGIPVISTETPGLKENCGEAGIFIKNRDDIKEWINAIFKMEKATAYKAQSEKCKKRASELGGEESLDKFEYWLREMVYKYN